MKKLLLGKQSDYDRVALPESSVTRVDDYLNRRHFIQRWQEYYSEKVCLLCYHG